MTVTEKIAQNTLLLAVSRVAMVLALPVFMMGIGYIAALTSTVNSHTTDLALLKQEQTITDRRLDTMDVRTQAILDTLNRLTTDVATTKTDVGYLRSYIEDLKRQAKSL
jgi:hypothetical protein